MTRTTTPTKTKGFGALPPMPSCLGIGAPQWVLARTPTIHWGRYDGRLWVARPQATTPRGTTKTQTSLESIVSGESCAVLLSICEILHGGGAFCWNSRFLKPQIYGNVASERTEHINQETKHIKIPQNQYMDKVVDTSVAMQRQVLQFQIVRRKRQRCSAGNCFPIREGLDLRN